MAECQCVDWRTPPRVCINSTGQDRHSHCGNIFSPNHPTVTVMSLFADINFAFWSFDVVLFCLLQLLQGSFSSRDVRLHIWKCWIVKDWSAVAAATPALPHNKQYYCVLFSIQTKFLVYKLLGSFFCTTGEMMLTLWRRCKIQNI